MVIAMHAIHISYTNNTNLNGIYQGINIKYTGP